MQIVNISLGAPTDCPQDLALDYHVKLEKRGHQLLTILNRGSKIDTSKCSKNSITYIDPSKMPMVTAGKVKSIIASFDGEIVLAHGMTPLKYIRSRRSLKIPRVFMAHNHNPCSKCSQMDHCIATSSAVADHAIDAGILPENCHIIPSMTDMPLIKKDIELHNPPTFGINSELDWNEGVDVFLHAFKKLRDQNIIAKAIIASTGPEEDKLKSLVKVLNLEDDIEFAGWMTNKHQFYALIDVFVLPARQNPNVISVIETMAAGVPMIITDCKEPLSYARDGKEAYIVEKDNIIDLSGALYTILEDHHLRADLQYHQSITAKKFTPNRAIENLEATLNHIIQSTT